MPQQLFIVSRETPYLADYMRQQFSGEPSVEVLLDRRSGGDRRCGDHSASAGAPSPDRRVCADRRQRHDVDRQLREAFHALITVG
jgi:hypothetical protein